MIDAAKQPMVELQNVSFSYEGTNTTVLSDITLRIAKGQWISIVGPSGSGKSTLCSLIGGVLQRMSGNVQGKLSLFGTEYSSTGLESERLGQIGLIFQDPDSGLIHSHVEDELSFAPENLRVPPEVVKDRMEEALDAIGLPRFIMNRRTNELSGGQKQRVAIASILTMNPALLILDEAAIHLDQEGSKRLYEAIRSLHRAGHTIITTSSRWEALADPDQVIVLDHGRIVVSGDPASIRMKEYDRLIALGIETGGYEQSVSLVKASRISKHKSFHWETLAAVDAQSFGKNVMEVAGITFSFDGVKTPVLHDIHFELPERSFLAVLGENGSGKTTLGRLLVGLLPYEHGQITVRGCDIRAMSLKQLSRTAGYIFQNPDHQFVANTVWEECIFGETDEAIVTSLLEQFDLYDVKDANPYQLNQFQKRKLNLLTACLTKPELIVLDEPTAGLNFKEAEQFVSYCANFAKQGAAIVMITHDFVAIQNKATHALWL